MIQSWRDGWRCASITPGAQCVMTPGISGMQKWSADSLNCQLVVIHHLAYSCICAYAIDFDSYATIRGHGLQHLVH